MARLKLHWIAVAAAASLLGGPAAAHDHDPPMTIMKVDGQTQEGELVFVGWYMRHSKTTCVHGDKFGPDTYPAAIEVARGEHRARVRIAKRHKPDFLEVNAWQAVTPEGGAGPPDVLAHELQRVRREGKTVAWRVLFDVNVVKDLYVKVRATWADQEGCAPGEGAQMAHWNFHLEAAL